MSDDVMGKKNAGVSAEEMKAEHAAEIAEETEYLKEALTTLAQWDRELNAITEKIGEIEAEIKASAIGQEHEKAIHFRTRLQERMGDLEDLARGAAIRLYHLTGEKQVVPGAQAEERTSVYILDQDAAIDWARTGAPGTLITKIGNLTTFKQVVKALGQAALPEGAISIETEVVGKVIRSKLDELYPGSEEDA